jgi:6-pyruvoyltetrahydropterin/6-carboxytetrahydropterin synthase
MDHSPDWLTVDTKFASAHFLPGYEGQCKNLHGHTWKVKVKFGPYVERDGIGIARDFHDLKKILKDVCDQLDHDLINNYIERPTAENIKDWFYKELRETGEPVEDGAVTLWESDHASVS